MSDPVGEVVWQTWFCAWLSRLDRPEPSELVLRLTDDDEIRSLNARFRGIDLVTDVLSFEAAGALPPEEDSPLYLGDIVISVPCATRQAQKFGHSEEVELAWLAVHGLLHLLGWDHPDEEAWQDMVHTQSQLLKGVNVVYDWPRIYESVS